ncbi:Tim44 domain-containing protein [Derxia gummosa]|uniref:Tim44 domain-containing protein n=1 Tax=Derxia gummosa DSM 723 TaxID=1121388 RepID=A0A8B6XAP2_9BURK|nr:Tim44-like domain-containing protein [Derxia gummosa]
MSKTPSRLVAALVATAVTLSMTAPAEARLGGGKSSSSSSVSRSSSSSYSSGSSSRVGSGGASGMQRPEVMDRVRSGQTAQPAPSAQPGYAAPAAAPAGVPAQQGSGSWVKPALAGAAVGAVAGYALSEAARPDAPAAHGGGAAAPAGSAGPMDSAATGGAASGYGAPAHQSSGGGMWLWLLVGLLGAGAFYMWRRNSAQPRSATAGSSPYAAGGTAAYRSVPPTGGSTGGFGPEAEELQRFAPAFFKTMQDLNNAGDTDGLRKYTTPMMFEQLRLDIDQRGGARASTEVIDMRGEIVDFTRNGDGAQIASVRFRGHVSESSNQPSEAVDEVWHLLREQGDGWRLAGIEQV